MCCKCFTLSFCDKSLDFKDIRVGHAETVDKILKWLEHMLSWKYSVLADSENFVDKLGLYTLLHSPEYVEGPCHGLWQERLWCWVSNWIASPAHKLLATSATPNPAVHFCAEITSSIFFWHWLSTPPQYDASRSTSLINWHILRKSTRCGTGNLSIPLASRGADVQIPGDFCRVKN